MEKELLQIQATIEGISSRADKTWKLIIGTQELDEEQGRMILKLNRKEGYFLFKESEFKESDLLDIPEVKTEFKTDKTPSQRLRSVLWILWEQRYKVKYQTFEEFYKIQMEKIITWAKEKLD